jgi:oxaloacetate decarboxylase alpha subunit
MISNLFSQLEQQKALDRLHEVLEEIPRVRSEVGYPPLVTPMSQIVGTQAVLNVLTGKRWSIIPDEMKQYIKGLYGRAPGPIDKDIQKRILGDDKPLTCRPADLITETFDDYAKSIGDLARNEEDVITYALFPNEARKYLEGHKEGAEKAVFMMSEEIRAVKEDGYMDTNQVKELVKLVDESGVSEVIVEEDGVKISIRKGIPLMAEAPAMASAPAATQGAASAAPAQAQQPSEYPANWKKVTAPMVGTFYCAPSPDAPSFVNVGDEVSEGQTLCIVEAMKLMNEIAAEEHGVIRQIVVENGQAIEYGQALFLYEPI